VVFKVEILEGHLFSSQKGWFGSHNFNVLEFQTRISKQGAQVLNERNGASWWTRL
jgi:hypothetical protein